MKKLKKYLKKYKWIFNTNARLKERKTIKIYKKTVDYYKFRPVLGTFMELLRKRSGDRIELLKEIDHRLNIFYVGTDYLQDSSGILQALSKIGNLNYFTKRNGEYGQYVLSQSNMSYIRFLNAERLYEIIESKMEPLEVPDILIGQMLAQRIDGHMISSLKDKYGCLLINIAMDDRHQFWGSRINSKWTGTYGMIPYIDLFCTAAPECVQWYLKEGSPAIFLPEASDPDIFRPMPDLPKIHEVSFVGAKYGIREKIVETLRKSGVQVTTYGSGWKNGRISAEKVPRLFAQSKIIIGVGTIGHCRDFYALKMRDFDGPMSGSFYITHHNKDFDDIFEVGKEIETYRNIEECLEKVHYYLNNPDKREIIASCGRLKAEKEHTWEKRFKSLISLLELPEEFN